MQSRRASHAGSWYSNSARELCQQLDGWLQAVNVNYTPARAIISPHAGYSYSGSCAAYAFHQVNPALVKRIFILGPSHHVWMTGCALSKASLYNTPLYNLKIDYDVYKELEQTGLFEQMDLDVDENEHSIEMQLPYIARVMKDYEGTFTVVPILVGSLTPERERVYGEALAPYLADPQNLFVISSDFCHWGQRFRYTFYERSWGEIYQSIEVLDRSGMDCIENLSPGAFTEYLRKYDNTICGQHPISILLNMIVTLLKEGNHKMSMKFLDYQQSTKCKRPSDSSVSYAAASLVFN